MKYKILQLLLPITIVSCLLLTACGTAAPANATPESTVEVITESTQATTQETTEDVVVDINDSTEETIVDVINETIEETVELEEIVENDYSAFDPSNITVNKDGTYTYSEEFINAVLNMPQFANFTVDEIKIFLSALGESLIDGNDTGEIIYYFLDCYTEADAYIIIGGGGKVNPFEEDSSNTQDTNTTDQSDSFKNDITAMSGTKYSKGDVNVRTGPGTTYDKIGGLTLNQVVTITGKSESTGWYEIEFNGGKGYVSSSYLSDNKIQSPVPSNNSGSGSSGSTSTNPNINAGAEQAGNLGGADGNGNYLPLPGMKDPGADNGGGGVSTHH